jgi:hypothetical protein
MKFRLFMARLMYAAVGINLLLGLFGYLSGDPGAACFNALTGLVCYFAYTTNRRLYDSMVQNQNKTD